MAPAPTKADSKIEKWQRWLDRIEPEVLGMNGHRAVYREVARIVNEHGALPPSHFFDYLRDWYATTQATAVRRQAEISRRVISIASLLSEIGREPERLSNERFVAHYDRLARDHAHEVFAGRFAGDVGSHVDPAIIAADLDGLQNTAESVRAYVDRHIAHTDRDPLDELPTFEDLNGAIDEIGGLFSKYTLLLTASSWAMLEPVPQYDWLAIFREPWIK
jgi:hypothetical protein